MHRRVRGPLRLLLLGAIAFLGGCNPGPPRAALLISIDTLRADHLGSYGYARPTSPHLDALAREGTLFEDVTSTTAWTLPSHASMLTGLYPVRHGVTTHQTRLPDDVATLASVLGERGWSTFGIVNSPNLGRRHGLDRGFDEFIEFPFGVSQRSPSTLITDQVLSWLEAPREGPVLVFVHYYDVHSDYRSLEEHERRFLRPYAGPADGSTRQLFQMKNDGLELSAEDVAHTIDLYDAGIAQMDSELGRLFDRLREAKLLDETLVVVTSDHGEEFLEHGSVLHGQTHFQEVMRIPLMMRGPGVPAGLRVATPVSLVDVAPTMMAILDERGLEPDGKDLSPMLRGDAQGLETRDLFGEGDHGKAGTDLVRSLRHGRHAIHFERASGTVQVYDLERDPGERSALSSEEALVVAPLVERLRARSQLEPAAASGRELNAEEIDQLRELGYVE